MKDFNTGDGYMGLVDKKYGIKTIALFSDGGKRTELYKSSRTIAYYPANAIQTNGGI